MSGLHAITNIIVMMCFFFLQLFDLFSDDCLSSSAADGFSVILDDSEIGLSSKSRNSTISVGHSLGEGDDNSMSFLLQLFWKQQFFSEIVPELVTRFNQTPQGHSVMHTYNVYLINCLLQMRGSTS